MSKSKGLSKILANQIPATQGRYAQPKKGATLQHSASGLAQLAGSGGLNGSQNEARYPSSTINKYQQNNNNRSSGGFA